MQLYRELKAEHGRPAGQWALWCRRPKTDAEKERVVAEAILTQRANWKNVAMAWSNLAGAGADRLEIIARMDENALRELVRPSGFYRRKARRLRLAAGHLTARGGIRAMAGEPLSRLRPELLSLEGIGPETADDILLYALEKPVFVIDEYTRRLARRLGLAESLSYRDLQETFASGLRGDYRLYQDFHALIVTGEKKRRSR